jgi:hypothetical protein
MAEYFADIGDESGTKLIKVNFAGIKAVVATRKPGETVTFTAPIDAPRAEIDELVRLGCRKTFP